MKKGYSTKLFRSSLLCGAALLWASLAAAVQPSGPGEPAAIASFVLRPGVVVDPARSAIYLMETAGVIALELASGTELWRNDATAQPLALADDLLVTLAEPSAPGKADVVFLEPQSGAVEAVVPVALPATIAASIDEHPGRRFTASSAVSSDGVFLFWTYSERELRGAPETAMAVPGIESPDTGSPGTVPPDTKASRPKILQGVARIDLEARRALPVAPDARLPKPLETRSPDLQLGEALPDIPGRQFRAADDRSVMASEMVADARTWERYRWTFFDRTTGVELGAVDQPRSMAAFFITHSLLVHEALPLVRRLASGELEAQPLRLRAVDLASGRELWSVALRDTVYRGPLPP